MSRSPGSRGRAAALVRRAVVMATAAVVLGACATSSTAAKAPPSPAPLLPTPLATSVETAGGSWATVPMGHTGDVADTFWQLLYRPAGGGTWSDKVQATATATNGGLVLAASGGGSLVVGIRPSIDLKFTPLIATHDSGAAWSNGLIDQAVAARPDALAIGPGSEALAIVGGRAGGSVLSSKGGLSRWEPLVTLESLAGSAQAKGCSPDGLTAVAYEPAAAAPLLGTSCGRAGVVGLFALRSGRWSFAGRGLAAVPAGVRFEVLGVYAIQSGLDALVAGSRRSGSELAVAQMVHGGPWQLSPVLETASFYHLVSYGSDRGGLFALFSGPGGNARLELFNRARSSWRRLPSPPAGTATVADGPGQALDALAVNDTVLRVWTLAVPSGRWVSRQVMRVPIQFGSSNP
ncbi:MAG: hypothetical protein M0T79_02735 [Actinomycetota bacterium]|nr:hypothetical protein [Actinomycetota bacterium]